MILSLRRKERYSIDITRCFNYNKNGLNLRKPVDSGKCTFLNALSIRGRCGDFNIS